MCNSFYYFRNRKQQRPEKNPSGKKWAMSYCLMSQRLMSGLMPEMFTTGEGGEV